MMFSRHSNNILHQKEPTFRDDLRADGSYLQLGHAVVGGAVRRHQLPLPSVHEPRPDGQLRGRRALGCHVAHDLTGLAPRARDADVGTDQVLLVVQHNLR